MEDKFLVGALMKLGAPLWTTEFTKVELERGRRLDNLQGGMAFMYPHPAQEFPGQEAELNLVLRQSSGFQVSNARTVMIPLLEREANNWIRVKSNYKHLKHTNQLDVDWFIEKVQNFLPAFEPDFACGDTDVFLANRIGDDPTKVAWPLVYYGPTHAGRMGREKLLSAPVWEAKEDDRGGVWLQVAENPFVATKEEINSLASHLGLEKRR